MEFPQGLIVLFMALLTSPEVSVFCKPQIHITPENPIIKLSSPLTLNCSSSCASGKVNWSQMRDSVVASTNDQGHYSTMEFQSISEDDESFICEEKCGGKGSRATVKLYPFSGPTITSDPKKPETGRPFLLICTVKIHPELSAELKLKHGSRVLSTQMKCEYRDSSSLQDCEVSAAEICNASETQYECEATLQKESSQRTESAPLKLALIVSSVPTDAPTDLPTISPSAQPSSTFKNAPTDFPTISASAPPTQPSVAVHTERVTVQTEQPSSAFKKEEQSSSWVWVWGSLIICLVVLGSVILAWRFFRCKKHIEAQPQEKEEPVHFNNL